MKKLLTFIFVIALAQNMLSIGIKDINVRINKIIGDLDSTISNSPKKQPIVEEHFRYVIDKIIREEIPIVYDSTLTYSFYGCSSAGIKAKGKYNLAFGKFVVDAYDVFPHLAHGIIIHEFQHLYDFYHNQQLVDISQNNPIEKTYFEIDAITLEALYLQNYVGQRVNLSPLEKYLQQDINTGLSGSSFLFENADLSLLHRMDDIAIKKLSYDKAKKEFIDLGKELLQKTQFGENKWNNYCQFITLKTYVYYSRQVLHDILFHCKNKSITDSELHLKDYPDVNEVINQVLAKIKENESCLTYRNELLGRMESVILEKMKRK